MIIIIILAFKLLIFIFLSQIILNKKYLNNLFFCSSSYNIRPILFKLKANIPQPTKINTESTNYSIQF